MILRCTSSDEDSKETSLYRRSSPTMRAISSEVLGVSEGSETPY